MYIKRLDTPSVFLDKNLLYKNIGNMAKLAEDTGVKLRPHIKAHKCSEIAKIQMAHGAVGITVVKISEAEAMVDAGINDILIAFQLVTLEKMLRLKKLIDRGAKITCLIDDITHAEILNKYAKEFDFIIPVYVEVDSGLKRTGLEPEKVVSFIQEIVNFQYLRFSGILTHAGHVYGATREQVPLIGNNEGLVMEKIAVELQKNKIYDFDVSVGSTPTVKYSSKNPYVTEIRPGNYVFYDAIQVGLGQAQIEQCSLKVLTTVISKPTADRLVIDAGSKTLALDRGAHGVDLVNGFGIIMDYPNLLLERLSEEHGIVKVSKGRVPEIGEKLYIIPNHACPVVNLTDLLVIVEDDWVVDLWSVDARGRNK